MATNSDLGDSDRPEGSREHLERETASPSTNITVQQPTAGPSKGSRAKTKGKQPVKRSTRRNPRLTESPVASPDKTQTRHAIPPPGRSGSRNSSRSTRSRRSDQTDDQDNAALRIQLQELTAEVARLKVAQEARISVEHAVTPVSHQRNTSLPLPIAAPRVTTLGSSSLRYAIKLRDPDPLTDGVSPTFEDWEFATLEKLETNSWLFHDERMQFSWLCSLVSGAAREILAPHLVRGSDYPIDSIQEVYDLLRSGFSNPDAPGKAKDDLAKLIMLPGEEFYSFCAKFVQLASTAHLPRTEWKYELNRRLTRPLRTSVLGSYLQAEMDFNSFRAYCSASHQQLCEISRLRLPEARRSATTTLTTPKESPFQSVSRPPTTSRLTHRQVGSPAPEVAPQRSTSAPRLQSPAPLTCFACGETGHISTKCPNAGRHPTVSALNPVDEQEEQLLGADDDSSVSENELA